MQALEVLRLVVFGVFVVALAMAVGSWAVRTRRIQPFSRPARIIRQLTDPVIDKFEYWLLRRGGNPQNAGWWLVGSVVVDAWSTKEFDVAVSTSARYAPTPRTTVPSADPACVPTPGADGFTVDLVRTVTRVGDPTPLRSDTFTTTYQPEQAVVCQPAP